MRVEAALDVLIQATAPLDAEAARLRRIKAEAGDDPGELEVATREKALRVRERMMIEAARREVDVVAAETARLVTVSVRRLSHCADAEVAKGPNARLLEGVGPELATIAAALSQLGDAVTGLCDQVRASLSQRDAALTAVHSHQEDAYRALLGEHERDAARALEHELETVPVRDLPAMYLSHKGEQKRHDSLSSGQRIATFVRIMLLDPRGPFIADTPENDVSAYHLAMELCPALADLGAHGQYIIVSHNGNVPILGKAREVIEMWSPDGKSGVVKEAGPPKEVMVPMENHLEGGRKAFVQRRDFYEER